MRTLAHARDSGLGAILFVALLCGLTVRGQERTPVAAPPGKVLAPELVGDQWLNITNAHGPTLASCRGKVTVLHFWTFGCSNCRHNLPFYNRWQKRYAGQHFAIIGIHTPETAAERDPANVAKKVKELGLTYPVLLDPKSVNWNRWQQRWWPAVYVVDKKGSVRYEWDGELEYQGAGGNAQMTRLIDELLKE
jgi:thiol-disulfide isomerase/thioredoxin